jgi:hypothetical protein
MGRGRAFGEVRRSVAASAIVSERMVSSAGMG